MIAYNVTTATVRMAAATAGVRLEGFQPEGNGLHFVLRLIGERWRRRSSRGRRVAAVCWHGHRAFMEALFNRAPAARLKGTMADYNGRLDFWARHDATGNRNIGSIAQPMAYRDACDCLLEVA